MNVEPVYFEGALRSYEEGACSLLGHLIDFEDPVLQRWEAEIDYDHRPYLPLCFIGEDDSRGFTTRSSAEEVLSHLESRLPRTPEKDALVVQLRRLIHISRAPKRTLGGQMALFEVEP